MTKFKCWRLDQSEADAVEIEVDETAFIGPRAAAFVKMKAAELYVEHHGQDDATDEWDAENAIVVMDPSGERWEAGVEVEMEPQFNAVGIIRMDKP